MSLLVRFGRSEIFIAKKWSIKIKAAELAIRAKSSHRDNDGKYSF